MRGEIYGAFISLYVDGESGNGAQTVIVSIERYRADMGQPKILDFLKEHDGVSQKDIAKGCHIEAPSLTSILMKMEENGLVERRVLHGNRRSLYVFLTEKGKQNQKRVEEAFAVIEEAAFQGMKEEERKNFMISFMKIYDNLYRKKELFEWKN